jgi:hypothetical protein
VALTALLVLALGTPLRVGATERAPGTDACEQVEAPAWFPRAAAAAIRISKDLRPSWGSSPALARIVCWQGSGFDERFRRDGDAEHRWHGLFAMTVDELAMVQGRWLTRLRPAFHLRRSCFVRGWDACPHQTRFSARIQQLIAGMRWIWLTHGTPSAAWAHIVRTGRFSSLPPPSTANRPTRDPFRLCPVAGRVRYEDDFGEFRGVGGYHPHGGTDLHAPVGRAIRAPFGGFAVSHADDWFAGKWVSVIGPYGYVRNAHLSRFGARGWVEAGDVIGYVGQTGDARTPHDHFEWHPWKVRRPVHRSPLGYTRIGDCVDPFPFLNRVCERR